MADGKTVSKQSLWLKFKKCSLKFKGVRGIGWDVFVGRFVLGVAVAFVVEVCFLLLHASAAFIIAMVAAYVFISVFLSLITFIFCMLATSKKFYFLSVVLGLIYFLVGVCFIPLPSIAIVVLGSLSFATLAIVTLFVAILILFRPADISSNSLPHTEEDTQTQTAAKGFEANISEEVEGKTVLDLPKADEELTKGEESDQEITTNTPTLDKL